MQISGEATGEVPFALRVTVTAPRGSGNAAKLMKPAFDGAIAAFHSHDGTAAEFLLPWLANNLDVPASEIEPRLTSTRSPLGERRLIWPRKPGVQWNPADDRCIAGELILIEGDRWGQSSVLTSARYRRPT